MEFTVTKSALVRELGLSQGVVEKKTTIPILSNVLVEADGDRIVMTATDLELGIRCSCPARIVRSGAGTIPARRLLDYVRLLPESEIQVKFGENQWANLLCGRSRTRIAGMSRESFPELPEMPEAQARIPIGLLNSMIARTIFAISSEESRFTLNGSLLLLRPDAITMVSTDGHRLAMIEHAVDLGIAGPYKALLPRKAMQEIQKLASDAEPEAELRFAGDENHLFFEMGDRLLISRKLTGNFPDFDRVLPKEHPFAVRLGRDELRSSIERVAQFSDERSRAIRLRFENGELKIFSSLSDMGESEEILSCDYIGKEPVEIGFNAQYILDFLRAVSEENVTFRFRDPQSAGEMRPQSENGPNYRYVIMPMRI